MDANPLDNEEHKALHRIATAPRDDLSLDVSDGSFAIGVLHHEKSVDCLPQDFYWFKVKGKHSIAKIRSAYEKRIGVADITLRLAGEILEECTQMKNLNYMNNNIIVFTSHDRNAQPTLSNSTLSQVPLQPKNSQIPANIGRFAGLPNRRVKTESGLAGSEIVSTAAVIKDEYKDDQVCSNQVPFSQNVASTPNDRQRAHPAAAPWSSNVNVKRECKTESVLRDEPLNENGLPTAVHTPKKPLQNERILKIISDGTPEELEAEVATCKNFLEDLKMPMQEFVGVNKDAQHWVMQLDNLLKQNVDTPTIIGVVGNTGAGKSSVINAMLEEERLVPTNCMRACTAVVTEMSYNRSNDPSALYRADIEFIQASDWEKDLRISLKDLIDGSGQVSRDCTNPESEAGVAYAKIKAVYPSCTRDDLANSSVEKLLSEPEVRKVLGTTKKIENSKPEFFYKALQSYVDSKEKSTEGEKKKGEKKQMEFWPLIKVVRIYTKADALSTGAVIVDLPGVHDSNAARAAVAQGYMKQCTGLFIVAPINRAVDDKAAKSLLGESFKRQLKFDGTYSRITFICSKTDDISIIEASDSLGLEEQMSEDWKKIDEIEKKQRTLKQKIKDLKESKAVFSELIDDAETAIDVWDKLKDQLEDGETVYDPSKKRKRPSEPTNSRKKAKKSQKNSDDEDEGDEDFIDDEDEESDEDEKDEEDEEDVSEKGDPLTIEEIDAKISQFKDDKKRARAQRLEVVSQVKSLEKEGKVLERSRVEIDTAMSAICIEGRNNYSKGAIQRDFADGIRELDMESAQEEDPDQFNPEDDLRDYDEVAKSLPVFCVSSRAYQKLRGRLQRDKGVPGFRTAEETEIPQLQAHCKKLTEAGRASNCRNYLTNLCQLLNSLGLWAQNDGTGLNLTDAQLAAGTRFLKLRLKMLEESLDKAVRDCLKDMTEALAENIFENYEHLVQLAVNEANGTVAHWGDKVNRDNRALGGYYWATYKAIVRREGVYSNAQGPHDFNAQLTEPIIKHLASHWEKVFAQRLPRVLLAFSRSAKSLLTVFHKEIATHTMKTGTSSAGLALLGQQLRNYENIFATLSQKMMVIISDLQREANRNFTPVIARNLSSAYQYCTDESGSGQFSRMKVHMAQHVDTVRQSMFAESCEEVKGLLLEMCKQVHRSMSEHTDEVFVRIERDYLEVISGRKLAQGQAMPKFERKMRSDVARLIADREKTMLEEQERAANERAAAEEAAAQKEKEASTAADQTSAPPESGRPGETTAIPDNAPTEPPASSSNLPREVANDEMDQS
ncbi:hypothetical protein LZ554_002710 [Drepanopeziza brunnea f. sp. 'monogermtubi']|nr:hypothetical protein LZ554_002710 [Drepanopeziza brunnea f. sp. 'monogermtubi']